MPTWLTTGRMAMRRGIKSAKGSSAGMDTTIPSTTKPILAAMKPPSALASMSNLICDALPVLPSAVTLKSLAVSVTVMPLARSVNAAISGCAASDLTRGFGVAVELVA